MFQTLYDWLFDPGGLTPHVFYLLWKPGLIWTHALSDGTIGLAFVGISIALAIFAQSRRDLAVRPVFWLFATLILLCGVGHFLEIVTLWQPIYGLQAVAKVATAIVSVATALAVWPLLPHALALPSQARLQAAHLALRESEARHRASFERSPVPLHTLDGRGVIIAVSDSWLSLFGYRREQVIGRPLSEFRAPNSLAPNSLAPASNVWTETDLVDPITGGEARDLERFFVRADGSVVDVLVSARVERSGDASSIVCVLIDITARKRAEEALRASEEQLRQAQKMEAVGQLTGGIAHDFNNLLTAITGSLELLQNRVAQGRVSDLNRYVITAQEAARRAAALTHRLLAFSRRQTLDPRPVNLNRLSTGMEELVSRTMGPQIAVEVIASGGLWNTLADPPQLENALLNLCINARDAMPGGGRVTIETANKWLDERAARQRDLPGGQYVSLSVSDTGTGMTPEVASRAFDPFFTTKPIGLGTGLGLSMIYGFVRQSGGQVRIYSEFGAGTVVSLYLPRYLGEAEAAELPMDRAHVSAGLSGATVLVVDDEPSVRMLIIEVLDELGYTMLEAENGAEALKLLQSGRHIDLLVTDVGLPGGMSGRQVAEAARAVDPSMKVLFITGYAENAVMNHGHLEPGMQVLTKPFAMDALAVRVRDMLATV